MRSVHGFVSLGGTIVGIPDEEIVCLQRVSEQKTSWAPHPFLVTGQRVRVRGGAMDGVEGVFLSEKGNRSLVISVAAIRRSVAVRIYGYDVEPI